MAEKEKQKEWHDEHADTAPGQHMDMEGSAPEAAIRSPSSVSVHVGEDGEEEAPTASNWRVAKKGVNLEGIENRAAEEKVAKDKFWNVVTAVAAGSILRARADERGQAFMAVPDTKCGFEAVHQGSEKEMLKGLGLVDKNQLLAGDEESARKKLETDMLKMCSETCGFECDEIICPSAEDVLGLYEVIESKGCCLKEAAYPALDFAVYKEDVNTNVGTCHHPPKDPMNPKEGECKEHACGSGNVAYRFSIMSKNVNFRCSPLGCCFGCLPGDVTYHCTVSENGVVRFHLSPDRGTFAQLLFAYGDSESCCCGCFGGGCCGCCSNIGHALSHGCFCLGVYFREKITQGGPPPRVVLMRFNRWNDDKLNPYWAGVIHPNYKYTDE